MYTHVYTICIYIYRLYIYYIIYIYIIYILYYIYTYLQKDMIFAKPSPNLSQHPKREIGAARFTKDWTEEKAALHRSQSLPQVAGPSCLGEVVEVMILE